jgi:hypothetical protein
MKKYPRGISVRFTEELYKKLKYETAENMISTGTLIRMIVNEYYKAKD